MHIHTHEAMLIKAYLNTALEVVTQLRYLPRNSELLTEDMYESIQAMHSNDEAIKNIVHELA